MYLKIDIFSKDEEKTNSSLNGQGYPAVRENPCKFIQILLYLLHTEQVCLRKKRFRPANPEM